MPLFQNSMLWVLNAGILCCQSQSASSVCSSYRNQSELKWFVSSKHHIFCNFCPVITFFKAVCMPFSNSADVLHLGDFFFLTKAVWKLSNALYRILFALQGRSFLFKKKMGLWVWIAIRCSLVISKIGLSRGVCMFPRWIVWKSLIRLVCGWLVHVFVGPSHIRLCIYTFWFTVKFHSFLLSLSLYLLSLPSPFRFYHCGFQSAVRSLQNPC